MLEYNSKRMERRTKENIRARTPKYGNEAPSHNRGPQTIFALSSINLVFNETQD